MFQEAEQQVKNINTALRQNWVYTILLHLKKKIFKKGGKLKQKLKINTRIENAST